MTVEEISILAYRGEKPEKGLSAPERILWYALRDAYVENRINAEEGARQKKLILDQYKRDCAEYEQARNANIRIAQYWKRIEEPARNYAMNQTADTARRFFEAVYGVPLKVQKDNWKGGDDQ